MQQPIVTPFGVSVYGSAIVRVLPDIAILAFSVSRVQPHPKEAFQAVREAVQQVQSYLASVKIKDAGSSRISLREEFQHSGGQSKFVGYRTQVEFRVILSDLSRLEEILSGVVDAGANNIHSVDFQTMRIKEIRVEARRQAIAAARGKAETFCEAGGVSLGEVIHIEDLSHSSTQIQKPIGYSQLILEDDNEHQAFDPSSITVGAAVMVAFKIQGQ